MKTNDDLDIGDLSLLLAERAASFFPEFSGSKATARWVGSSQRVFSSIHEFVLSDPQFEKRCLVKVTRKADDLPESIRRPRPGGGINAFLPQCDPPGHEYQSLLAIERHFGNKGNTRFATLKARGTLFENHAFVMDKAQAISLSTLIRRNIFQRKLGEVVTLITSAGQWLREFHGMAPPGHTNRRYGGLAALKQELDDLTDFLGPEGGKLGDLTATVMQAISSLEEVDLQLGIHHGDFAPRNVLVFDDGRIAVIDTLAEDYRPIFEDIAHFLVDLRTNKLQAISGGLAVPANTLASFERAFLEAYFGEEPIPWVCIRIFETRMLLIRWATMLWERKQARHPISVKSAVFTIRLRAIRNRLKITLRELADHQANANVFHRNSNESLAGKSISETVQQRASNYVSCSVDRELAIKLQRRTENKFSSILHYRIESQDEARQIVVKLPKNPLFSQSIDTLPQDRPRLTVSMPPGQEILLEHVAMKRVEDHFEKLGDPRLQAVKILDFLPDHNALVMEEVDSVLLTDILRSKEAALIDTNRIFANIGTWLREFHQMPVEHAVERDLTSEDFKQNLRDYTEFMWPRIGREEWFSQVQDRVERLIDAGALGTMEIGTAHGDFAPQNLFVGRQGQIRVIDILARWRKPVYEDISHFLCVLSYHGAMKQGGTGNTFREHFLGGYFGDRDIPMQKILLFQLLIFFDKWCSHVFSQSKATGVMKMAKLARLAMINRKMRFRIDSILTRLEQGENRKV